MSCAMLWNYLLRTNFRSIIKVLAVVWLATPAWGEDPAPLLSDTLSMPVKAKQILLSADSDQLILARSDPDDSLCFFSLDSGKCLRTVHINGHIRSLFRSNDGKMIGVLSLELDLAGEPMRATFLSSDGAKQLASFAWEGRGGCLSPDSRYFFTVLSPAKGIDVWDFATRRRVKHLDDKPLGSTPRIMSPDGDVIRLKDTGVEWVNADSGKILHSIEIEDVKRQPHAVRYSASGETFVTVASSALTVYDAKTFKVLRTFDDTRQSGHEVYVALTDTLIAYLSNEGTILVYRDVSSGKELFRKEYHSEHPALEFSPDGKYFAWIFEGEATVWKVNHATSR
jgi:WD40 repeat protein